MNTSAMDWGKLNAYVDGELPPDEAAEIAEALVRAPQLARQVATISALKAAIHDSAPPFAGPLPEQLHRSRPLRPRLFAATAALLLTLLCTTVWFAELHRAPPGIALAERSHQQWLAAPARHPTGQAGEALRVRLDALRLAYVPDLTQVGLVFDSVRQISARASRGLHVGYRGPHGCVVSLVVFEGAGDHDTPLTPLARGQHTAWRWTTGGASFFLLAPAMDPVRLAGTAEVVQRLTRARLPLDSEAILALAQSRQGAAPCLS